LADSGCGEILLREARDADAEGVIAVIAAAYAEFPGCILDVEADSPELKAPASSYALKAGRFWVAAGDKGILGCVACQPAPEGGLELEKLYVTRAARRRGLGARLLGLVEAEAEIRQASYIMLWTDTRFEDAHRFYQARGFRRAGLRRLADVSQSVEYGFRKDL
jgi:putative acetyltransferase